MFKRLHDAAPVQVTVYIEGEPVKAAARESVAAVLLLSGPEPFGASAVSEAPRAPYCMIGNCFECLVEVDGAPNRQACMVPVAEGMRIRRQCDVPDLQP